MPLYANFVYRLVTEELKAAYIFSQNAARTCCDTLLPRICWITVRRFKGIKELLGHSSLAATQVYTHNSVEKMLEIFKQAHPRA